MNRDPGERAAEVGGAWRFVRARRLREPQPAPVGPGAQVHPAAAAAAGAAAVGTRSSPLAVLLAGHVLRDGEVVLLVLKPSLWFILFQSIRFIAAVLVLLLVTRFVGDRWLPAQRLAYLEAAVFVIAGRVMWAVLQWMGRLYMLTDQRIIRLAGVFSIDLYDCPLRRVAATRVTASVKERACHLGSIEITPRDGGAGPEDCCPVGAWQTIARPAEVHEQVQAAVRRAQNGG